MSAPMPNSEDDFYLKVKTHTTKTHLGFKPESQLISFTIEIDEGQLGVRVY